MGEFVDLFLMMFGHMMWMPVILFALGLYLTLTHPVLGVLFIAGSIYALIHVLSYLNFTIGLIELIFVGVCGYACLVLRFRDA